VESRGLFRREFWTQVEGQDFPGRWKCRVKFSKPVHLRSKSRIYIDNPGLELFGGAVGYSEVASQRPVGLTSNTDLLKPRLSIKRS
jgi:hypothetical protein